MLGSLITPAQILGSYRKSDAVLIVCQNNTSNLIEIAAINEEATRLTGYTNEALVNKPFDLILPERLTSTLAEFVEYGDERNDLLQVLGKIRNFAIKTRDGREMEFHLRVIRGEAIGENPWFHLVLMDEKKLRQINSFRQMLRENFKGHEIIDDRVAMPVRNSFVKDLELVIYYVRDKKINAAFAAVDINHYDKLLATHGEAVCRQIYKHIGHICKQKLRGEDTVGVLTDRTLGLLLVDAEQEPARMVLNRLRWAISVTPLSLPKSEVLTQANIGFAQIDGTLGETEILDRVEKFMEAIRPHDHNILRLIVTHNRRGEERRKGSVPVETDRRKRPRRDDLPPKP